MDINFELYRVFYYVATLLSFSDASKQLFISQSAVSQSIKTLEKKLNSKLFYRSTKKVTLTPEGEILFKHIEPAINLIKNGERQLLGIDSLNGGQIRIGASDTICRYYLVPYLNEFHQKYPNIHIKVMNQTSLKCVELLNSGLVDLIIINYPNTALKDSVKVEELKEFRDVFLGGEKYAKLSKEKISLKELQKHPILMLDRKSTTSEFLHQIFQKYQLDLAPEIQLSSNDLLLDLARIGLGIAFVPDFCVPKDDKDLFLISTKEELPSRKLVVAYNDKIPLSITTKEFLNQLEIKM